MLTSFGVLTAAIAGLGAATGAIDRVERNNPDLFWIGVVLVLGCVALSLLGLLISTTARVTASRRRLWSVGFLLMLVGGATLVATLGLTSSHVLRGLGVGIAFSGLFVAAGLRYRSKNKLWLVLSGLTVAGAGVCLVGATFDLSSTGAVRWVAATSVGLGAVLFALGFALGSSEQSLQVETVLYAGGVVAFLVGMAYVTSAVIFAASVPQQPSITAILKEGSDPIFQATARATGMTADEHLRILVEGISPPLRDAQGRLSRGDDGALTYDHISLYSSSLGPDAAGTVDDKLELPLTAARPFDSIEIRAWVSTGLGDKPNDCFTSVALNRHPNSTGCLTVRLPWIPRLPELDAALKTSGPNKSLVVSISDPAIAVVTVDSETRGLKDAATSDARPLEMIERPNLIAFAVTEMRNGAERPVYQAVMTPNASGELDRTVELPVGNGVRWLCAVASALAAPSDNSFAPIVQPRAHCPRPTDTINPNVVWVRLVVPH
jgi:hypothetical protein